MRTTTSFLAIGLSSSLILAAVGCGSEAVGPVGEAGGAIASGGGTASGGAVGNGGGPAGGAHSGGASGSGGTSPSGGTAPSGGASASGSATSAGGSATGGAASDGGAASGGANSAPPTMTAGTCKQDLGGYQNGSVTYYTFQMGTTEGVNCGNPELGRNPDRLDYVDTGDGTYFGAMNTSDYNTAATCGACVEVTRDGNRKVTLTIADRCPVETNPKCQSGHIDLSQQAFNQIGQQQEGHLGNGGVGQIAWKYVPCPDGSTVLFTLKEADNEFWNQVLVSGAKYKIQKLEVLIDGSWIPAVRQMYNYWEPPEGIMGADLPYRVRATDENGSVIEAPVELKAGAQDSGLQFECN